MMESAWWKCDGECMVEMSWRVHGGNVMESAWWKCDGECMVEM